MYPGPRTKGYSKADPVKRWALPDRVFFASGACHVLAYAFLKQYGAPSMRAVWMKPGSGFVGNHIFIDGGEWVFDYHGYSGRVLYLKHAFRRARHYWPAWTCQLVDLPEEVLISEKLSREYEGLWLREPGQFLQNALPRASAFLRRFPSPP